MTNFSELKQDLHNKNIFLDPRKTATHQDNKLWIKLINNIIDSLSKHNTTSLVSFFQQSSSHFLIAMITLKYFFLKKDLHKTQLIDLIITNNIHHKSSLSENKYIDDSIAKGYIHLSPSSTDRRKKTLKPSEKMIAELQEWLLKIVIT